MYAVVESGGKQYRVCPGETIKIEKIEVPAGEDVILGKVLLVGSEDGSVIAGRPVVEGANIKAKVLAHGRNRKVIVFKYRRKSNYRRKQGHRQPYTLVRIESIDMSSGSVADAAEG